MKLGIIGLPQSGKTTIFNALTGGNRPVGQLAGGGRFEVNQAVVNVPDERVDKLSALFKPKKTIYAQVTYADIAGLDAERGAGKSGFSGPLLNQLAQMDGFLHVVRAFESASVPHPSGSVNPARDMSAIETDLLLQDMLAVERKLERLNDELRKGGVKDKTLAQREQALFQRLHETLSAETPLRELSLTAEEDKGLASYAFLTRKPLLQVINIGDDDPEPAPPASLKPHTGWVALRGRLEMEIAQLPPADAAAFLSDYGIAEPSLRRMIRLSYDLLGLQSFFTVGEDEVRAWTTRRGAAAPEAAGQIHTDLREGFIRAEVYGYDDLMEAGGVAEVRHKGRFRLEGKEYIVKDGDILNIRFSPPAKK